MHKTLAIVAAICTFALAGNLEAKSGGGPRGGGGGHSGGHASAGGHSSHSSTRSSAKSPKSSTAKSAKPKSAAPKPSGATSPKTENVKGYTKKDGTHVDAYKRTAPDSTKRNNFSTKGNVNPYTGKPGTKDPDKK